MMIRFRRSKKIPLYEINPDEVLLDARNLPDFDVQQFEGRIEKPISKKTINFFSVAVFVVGILFLFRVGYVSIIRGDWYLTKSEQNSFDKIPLFADRGMIYDRNQMLLAWNTDVENRDIPDRTYIGKNGFSHILGYVSYPNKDSSGRFWQTEFVGRGGVEKLYNDDLSGINGAQVMETDVHGEVQSKNIVNPPTDGAALTLSIDGRVQEQLYNSIVELAEKSGYTGGAGLIMDVQTGELLALTSYPEYNANILSKGEDRETINLYNKDKRKVFLNRALSGLYSPGSIVKPFLAIGALAVGVQRIVISFDDNAGRVTGFCPRTTLPSKKNAVAVNATDSPLYSCVCTVTFCPSTTGSGENQIGSVTKETDDASADEEKKKREMKKDAIIESV